MESPLQPATSFAPGATLPPLADLYHQVRQLLPPEARDPFDRYATALAAAIEARDVHIQQLEHAAIAHQIDMVINERDLQAFIQICQRVASETDLHALLDLIIRETSVLVDADRSTLFLVDRDNHEIYSRIAQGRGEIRLPIGEGIAGNVALDGEVIRIDDAYHDQRFDPSFDRRSGYLTHSILAVPMRDIHGKIVGVVQAINKNTGNFTDRDVEMLLALASQAAVAVENARMHIEMKQLIDSTLRALGKAIDARDPYTQGHSYRVMVYSVACGRQLGLRDRELRVLELAAAMHDLGKIGVPDQILGKPSRLTDEEYATIKKHVVFTHEILSEIFFPRDLRAVPEIAGSHHEKLDGSGYPRGLRGEQVPFLARIIAVADVFDAITSDRPYLTPMADEQAFGFLEKGKDTHFDPVCVDAFIEWRRAHPEQVEVPK